MLYLVRKHDIRHGVRRKSRKHIWVGGDTACTMASTGGLALRKYEVIDYDPGFPTCKMCVEVFERPFANKSYPQANNQLKG